MSKLIIQNDSHLSDIEALERVIHVIGMGRISSDDCYCFATTFHCGVVIFALKNEKSDRFIVQDIGKDK